MPAGAQPSVILVHGLRTSRTMWRSQLEALADAGIPATAIDLPGHGERTDQRFSLAAARAVIGEAVATAAESGARPYLVGFSLGGYLAIDWVAANPGQVCGLLAAGSAAEPRPLFIRPWQLAARLIHALPDRGRALNDFMVRLTVPEPGAADVLAGRIPFWYCGATPRSARLAAEYADGWMPGRISMGSMEKRISVMRDMTNESGRPMPTIAVIPPTSVESTREKALADVNVPGLLEWANKAKFAVKPPSGVFETVEDLEGQLIAGSPDEVVEEVKKFQAAGVEHLVFDFRFKFDRFFEQIEILGNEVLPKLR